MKASTCSQLRQREIQGHQKGHEETKHSFIRYQGRRSESSPKSVEGLANVHGPLGYQTT